MDITNYDNDSMAYTLLRFVWLHAPTQGDADKATKKYSTMSDEGVSSRDRVKAMTNMLADGLNHGNWPWT